MPAKYRKMGDFHEYYSGARRAPFLTIFIGGNHEASNHLFELYYGGWVAPNIYYMGAANILRLGPLRIAALSGIWKGYDYRKPHFERVPYNESESVSIFHVRELDVRKLLSVRTQVDVGLSHDWPQGIEWEGDFRWLFNKKDRFEADASEGRLGSVAARQCLDRLRPNYWFSAHLHVKYAATKQHGDYEHVRPSREHRPRHGTPLFEPAASRPDTQHNPKTTSNLSEIYTTSSQQDNYQNGPPYQLERPTEGTSTLSSPLARGKSSPKINSTSKTPEQVQVSAWQNFQVEGVRAEAQDTELRLQEQRERTAEEERTGVRNRPHYTFDETWKQVQIDDRVERGITSISKTVRLPGEDANMANLDGCVESKLKRRRSASSEDTVKKGHKVPPSKPRTVQSGQLDGQVPAPAITGNSMTSNVDEIEIDISDSSSDEIGSRKELPRTNSIRIVPADVEDGVFSQPTRQISNKRAKPEVMMSDDSDEGGVKLDPTSPPFVPKARCSSQSALVEEESREGTTSKPVTVEGEEEKVSESMRAQLAELSSTFAPPSHQQPASAPLPLPKSIANNTTRFLALDKCERGRDFLQLLEVESITEQSCLPNARPYRLQYDKEWLAILRVFAPDLELGGDPNGKVPPDRGDTYYRDRIIEEEKWIEEHVVLPNRLTVPDNFTITAPVYDPDERVSPSDKPHEYTNPQTSTFCELIGIDNKFDISEAERKKRMDHGPRPVDRNFSRGGRGGGRSSKDGGSNGRGRGGYNVGRGRGRGRGGRGRGRGGW